MKCLGGLSCRSKMTMIEPVDMEVTNDYQSEKRWVLKDTSRVCLAWEEVQVFFKGYSCWFFQIYPTDFVALVLEKVTLFKNHTGIEFNNIKRQQKSYKCRHALRNRHFNS